MREKRLIKKAQKGDNQAFGELYDQYLPAIYRFIVIKVGNKADAEDISHQVFLNAWQKMPKYKHQGFPFSSWLYRIAHNAVIDFYRTSKHHIDIDSVPEDSFSETPETDKKIDDLMQTRIVKDAIKELNEDEQNVIIMKFVNELSNKEIAASLEKSEGAVRVMQHRALKQLKTKIDARKRNTKTIK